jgi:hypothetical protein
MIIGQDELPNARPYNPDLRADSDLMRGLVSDIVKEILHTEKAKGLRKRARRDLDEFIFKLMVESLVCDLAMVTLFGPYEAVHLPLSHKILNIRSRYKSTRVGKTLPKLLEVMSRDDLQLVEINKGKMRFEVKDQSLVGVPVGGIQTTIKAGPRLLAILKKKAITIKDIADALDVEHIILRAPKDRSDLPSKNIEYEDTAETQQMRQEVADINRWIAHANIESAFEGINTKDRRLRRIFSNSDFKQGGRLYGGFWQRMSSYDRETYIEINGDAAVECDYGQMSVMLLYAKAGAKPPKGDLYDLTALGYPTSCRPGIKKVIQTIINTQRIPKRFPQGTRKYFKRSTTFADVVKAIEAKHTAIFGLMTSGIGMQMFRMESDILVDVLLSLESANIVGLPVHDAVLVADGDKDRTRAIMQQVFKDHTGLIAQVA